MPKIMIDISEVAVAQLRHLAKAEAAADLAAEQAGYGISTPDTLEPFSVGRRYSVEDVVADIIDRAFMEHVSHGRVPRIPGDPMDDDLPF